MRNDLLKAIVDDDQALAEKMLSEDPSLATLKTKAAKLYKKYFTHWLYAGDTALHLAAAGHRFGMVKLLLAAGADVNLAGKHRSSTPLHYAADGDPNSEYFDAKLQVATIRLLLKAGAEIDAKDANGATPIHRAVRARCSAAVGYLIESGANVKLKNKTGSTPLMLTKSNTGKGGSGTDVAKAAREEIKVLLTVV